MSDSTQRIDHVSEKLSDARLLLCDLFPYYAQGLYSMIPVETQGKQLETMAVDRYWRLYYSPAFVDGCQLHEVAAVLLHELLHLLRNHHERIERNGFEPRLGNVAADAEINDDINEHERYCSRKQRLFSLPKGGIQPRSFGLPDGLFMEEYYAELEQRRERIVEMIRSGEIALDVAGKTPDGDSAPWELSTPRNERSARGIKPEEAVLVRTRVAESISSYGHKHPGSVPGGMSRWAETILEPKVSWQSELRATIRGVISHIEAAGADVSWRRMNRRQAQLGDILYPTTESKLPIVAIVIDTSGSMDEVKQLPQCLAEVKGILRTLNCLAPVTVLSVDVAVHAAQTVFDASQIELMGGGGTDMGEGIYAAMSLRPRPDFIIVLTDGFTPWPETAPDGVKVIVALVGDGCGPDWAKTIDIS